MGNAFKLQELDGKIAQLTFDVPDQKVNTFSHAAMTELSKVVEELEKRTDLKGLLFVSGKPGQFIAGADLNELGGLIYADKAQVEKGMRGGHVVFNRIGKLPFPTVALIDGNCMGGGTELALSMDYRIASDSPKTKIGLPEVKIGIIPGWGGTQRMPRVIGVHHAIDMIASGEPISGQRAAELGLVFDSVPSERLIEDGKRLLEHSNKTGEWKEIRKKMSQPMGLTETQMLFDFAVSEGGIRMKTKGQYPAPLAALAAIRDGINQPLEKGIEEEIKQSLTVAGTPISSNLIAVFFMSNQIGRNPGMKDPSAKPLPVKRVGVLGAGQMGAGIATSHARSGIPTALVDIDDQRVAAGLKSATDVVAGRMKIGRATPQDMASMLANLNTSTSQSLFSDCDVVVEAVTENEQLKTKIYKQLAGVMKKDAILATNTSTISITRMAESAPNPERFVGMHFFYPVDRMQLVEIIRGEKTSEETIATIVDLSRKIRKTPIVVGDCPGFLVNRVLMPYMNEALTLLLEGASMDLIDKVATKFGMPVGPITLQDMVGLDTSYYAGSVLVAGYSDRAVKIDLLRDLVEAGRLGVKSGAGFRKHTGKKGKAEADPAFLPFLEKNRIANREFTEDEVLNRLLLPMLLESTRVLEDGIVTEPAQVDMGLILGIGFPPFRGGILRWADEIGVKEVVARAEKFASLGKRFEPTPMLRRMAQSGEKFYPPPKTVAKFGG